jgi:hypothetical protein
MKLEFPRQSFEKYSNIKFHKNLSSGSRVVPCGGWGANGQTQDEANILLRNFAKALKSLISFANPSNEDCNPPVHVAW